MKYLIFEKDGAFQRSEKEAKRRGIKGGSTIYYWQCIRSRNKKSSALVISDYHIDGLSKKEFTSLVEISPKDELWFNPELNE